MAFKIWKTCECGEEFLTMGAKVFCNHCLIRKNKERKGHVYNTEITPRPCLVCGKDIPHTKGEGKVRYSLKKTCSIACSGVF